MFDRTVFVRSGYLNVVLHSAYDNETGAVLGALASGLFWSKSANPELELDTFRLAFDNPNVFTANQYSRYWGMSLRCLAIE